MRRTIGWMLATALALPGTGCLTLGRKTEAPTATTTTSNKTAEVSTETEIPTAKKAEVFLHTATQLEKKGTPKESLQAIAAYENARSLDPSVGDRIAHHLAVLYDKTDQLSKAEPEYQRALKLAPKNANLLNDYGYHWYCRGNWTEAEKYFRQALAIDAQQAKARTNLGMALAQQGRDNEALEAFQQVVGPAEALANLGFILLVRGQKDEARAAYKRALTIDPNSRIARAALARLDAPPTSTAAPNEPTEPLGGRSAQPIGAEN